MGVHLFELNLMRSYWDPKAIEDQEACACRSLVDSSNVPILELLFILLWYLLVLGLSAEVPLGLSSTCRSIHVVGCVAVDYEGVGMVQTRIGFERSQVTKVCQIII